MTKYIIALTSAALLSFPTAGFSADSDTASKCLKLKLNVQKYSDLIKKGGTEAQMRSWNLAKKDNADRLADSNCK